MSMSRSHWLAPLGLLIMIGCSGGDATDGKPRVAISGAVTLDGSPLSQGSIIFVPKDPAKAEAAMGKVVDGKYAFDRAEGPLPGAYLVQINAVEGESEPVSAAEALENAEKPTKSAPKNKVAAKFNLKSELTAEVKADGPTTFDFAVTSK